MSHYFTDNENMPHNRKEYSFRFLSFHFTMTSDDGVFSKSEVDEGTEILLKTATQLPVTGRVLDLGCGTGVISMVLKKWNPEINITGIDVNSRALELTKQNMKRNQLEGNFLLSDGLSSLPDTYDWVISNPPIRVGKEKLYSLFDEVYEKLNKSGVFLFVIRKSHGAQSAKKKCESLFSNCEIIERSKGYYILLSRKN